LAEVHPSQWLTQLGDKNMTIDNRLFWFGAAVLLFGISWLPTYFGVADHHGGSLLGLWRSLVMIASFIGAVLSFLFGVLRLDD
jgi:hypothetical protein